MSFVDWLLNVLIPTLVAAVIVPPLLLWLRKLLEWLIRRRIVSLDWLLLVKIFAVVTVITAVVFTYLPPHSVTRVDWCATDHGTTLVRGNAVRRLLRLPAAEVAVQVKIFLAGSPEPLQEKVFGTTDGEGRFRVELHPPQPNQRSLYLINAAYNYESPFLEDRWYTKNFWRANPPRCGDSLGAAVTGGPVPQLPPIGQSGGAIERPKPGATADPAFPAGGTIQLRPSEVGWLAVRKGALFWPKEPSITKSGPWTRTVFEGGPPGKFSLALIAVDAATNARIINWFEQGRRTGSYPGMLLGEGIRVLDEIEVILVHP